MTDDDMASEREQEERDRAIAAQRARIPTVPAPQPEFCIEGCGDPTMERSRFCSKDCAEAYTARHAQLQRSGKR